MLAHDQPRFFATLGEPRETQRFDESSSRRAEPDSRISSEASTSKRLLPIPISKGRSPAFRPPPSHSETVQTPVSESSPNPFRAINRSDPSRRQEDSGSSTR
jgi:hypothetical protein